MGSFTEDQIEQQIAAWYENLSYLGKLNLQRRFAGYDVYSLTSWPEPDSVTLITVGLSGFLLRSEAGEHVGQELVLSSGAGVRLDELVLLIDKISDQVLDRRHPIENDEDLEIQLSLDTKVVRMHVHCCLESNLDATVSESELFFPIFVARVEEEERKGQV